jgi:hypothetical protein
MMEGDDVPSMESLIQELACSRLDASSPSKRKKVVQKAAKRLTENADDRSELASLKGEPSILLPRKVRTAVYVEKVIPHNLAKKIVSDRLHLVPLKSWRSSHEHSVLHCPGE